MSTVALPRTERTAFPRLRDPALLVPLVGTGVLIYLAILPLFMLLKGSFEMEVAPREFVLTLQNYQKAYASEYTYSTFVNSLIFASGSASLTFLLGTILAWLTERTNTPLRGLFVPIAVVPLILPGVLESIAWIFLLSPKFGYVNVALMYLFGMQSPPFNVFSLPGMIWVHSVGQVPLAFLMMVAAFKSMDPSLEESAMMSGANTGQTLRRVTLRLLMPYFILVVLLPFLVLFWASFLPFFATPSWDAVQKLSLDNYRYLLGFRPFWDAMQNSILLATLTATVAMMLTSLIAWIVYKSRLPGSWLLDFLAFIPITVPGIVMGMALILLYVAFPLPIYGTIWLLLIAYVTRYIPYGMRSASGSILQIHSELEEAASASGASWWETFKRVTLQLLRPGIAAGWIYICIVSFREFSTSVLLATGESRVL